MSMPAETVVAHTEHCEIVLTRFGFGARCTAHGCPWAGSFSHAKHQARQDAETHDRDEDFTSFHAQQLWSVAVRVVANVRAVDGWEAVRRLDAALRKAGFDVMADDLPDLDVCSNDVSVGASLAEEGTEETELPA